MGDFFRKFLVHAVSGGLPAWVDENVKVRSSRWFRGFSGFGMLLVSGVLIFGSAYRVAAETEEAVWIAGDGVFGEPSNWELGSVPGPGQVAVFAPEGEITVTFAEGATFEGLVNNGLAIGADSANLIFELGGNSIFIGGDEFAPSSPPILLEAGAMSGPRITTFRNGRVKCTGISLNNSVDPKSSLLVIGEGAELDSPIVIGNNYKGALRVESGGSWISRSHAVYIGRVGVDAEGMVDITGEGSSWQALGPNENTRTLIGVGAAGNGSLRISQGGKTESFIVQLAGHQAHLETPPGEGRGHLVVENSGSELDCAFLYVGGGVSRASDSEAVPGGAATVEVVDEGTIRCGMFRVFPHTTLKFRGGTLEQTGYYGELTMSDQATLEPSSVLHFVLGKAGGSAPLLATDLKIDGALLEIELGEGFSGRPGEEFPLISASGILEASFSNVKNGDTIEAGGRSFTVDLGPQNDGPIVLRTVR